MASTFWSCVPRLDFGAQHQQEPGETVYLLDLIRERLEYPALRRRIVEVHRRWSHRANFTRCLSRIRARG